MKRLIEFLKCHSLICGLILMFLFTWTIDLSASGVLPFKVPFALSLVVGWGFIFVSLLMTGVTEGKKAAIALLKRFLVWRVKWNWYLAAFLLLPAIQLTSVLLSAMMTRKPLDFSSVMAYKIFDRSTNLLILVIPWFLYDMFTNGEEMGWRGYVLPRLQARYNALVSSLIVGVLWGAWHLPKFFGTGANNEQSIGWFMAANVALAVLYTWFYNSTQGSLLLVTLFHASGNTAGLVLPISFAVPGGIMANILVILYIIAAAGVILLAGPRRLSRKKPKQTQVTFTGLEVTAQ